MSDTQMIWQDLKTLQESISKTRIEDLFEKDENRAKDYSVSSAGILLDYSKNFLDDEILDTLIDLAESCHLSEQIDAMFTGKEVNNTEHRPALHTALRNDAVSLPEDQRADVLATFEKMAQFVDELHSGRWLGYTGKPIAHVVNIGIGGSDLGPMMATLALTPYAQDRIKTHFVSNIDSTHITEILKRVDPETTLFIVASKSFKTIETRKNAEAARAWCLKHGMKDEDIAKHFVAVSTNLKAVEEFGIDSGNIFPMWDWVGGRYSLWSAIGLPIAVSVGMQNFRAMLHGAREMDEHFRSTELRNNMPVILGLLGIWYINFFDCEAQVVVPYDHYLNKFPSFLQQLEMESNGKSVHRDGKPVEYHTMGAIFGEAGSNTQHSFHQLLHQGTHLFPVDFIVTTKTHNEISDQHTHLYSNCLSQSRALMCGKNIDQVKDELRAQGMADDEIEELAPHKVIPGNKPSNTIVMKLLTPETLGALISLYEQKVFVQSVIWDIDAFDQWGVELGKVLSENVFDALTDKSDTTDFDGSTKQLIELFKKDSI